MRGKALFIQDIIDQNFMRKAIQCASEGIQIMEFPYGACIALENELISISHNRCFTSKDPTMHAEMIAIREASRILGTPYLQRTTIYSTTEPCVMCMGALNWARIPRIVYGTSIQDSIDQGFPEVHIPSTEFIQRSPYPISLKGGVLQEECKQLFQSWSHKRRFIQLFENRKENKKIRQNKEE